MYKMNKLINAIKYSKLKKEPIITKVKCTQKSDNEVLSYILVFYTFVLVTTGEKSVHLYPE